MTVFGTRPQFIKCALVSNEMAKRGIKEILVNTGQHYDNNMSSDFIKELSIPKIHYNLGTGSDTALNQISNIICSLDRIITNKIKLGIVYGDTNSTLAAALAFVKKRIPILHVEAGVRSFDLNMYEEQNRIMVDGISSILCTPTKDAVKNLHIEGMKRKAMIYQTGDVMYDLLLQKINDAKKVKFYCDKYILATIHREENTNDVNKIKTILAGFEMSDRWVIFPAHPRTKKMIDSNNIEVPANINIISPVSYTKMLAYEMNADKIVTDSGGVQKEAYMLGVPCITIRDSTEWLETIRSGMNELVPMDKKSIACAISKNVIRKKPVQHYGDGNAHKKIVDIIKGVL